MIYSHINGEDFPKIKKPAPQAEKPSPVPTNPNK